MEHQPTNTNVQANTNTQQSFTSGDNSSNLNTQGNDNQQITNKNTRNINNQSNSNTQIKNTNLLVPLSEVDKLSDSSSEFGLSNAEKPIIKISKYEPNRFQQQYIVNSFQFHLNNSSFW
uniref:hypothetical protein n=1 Tax=Ganoderma multipileum TaxID=1173714 RepID=UPI001F135429|nr:hypothetical protein MN835_mgp05 [Ganoderma multipileum]ULO25600.1 hypothetical protein [Ganoderma multipileum]